MILTIINTLLIVIPVIITVFAALSSIPNKYKIVVYTLCLAVFILGCFKIIIDINREKAEKKRDHFYQSSIERQELFLRGLSESYIDDLGSIPLYKHSYLQGIKYKENNDYEKAVQKFFECMQHPDIELINRIKISNLIAVCHIYQDRPTEAKKYLFNSLNVLKRKKFKNESKNLSFSINNNLGVAFLLSHNLRKARKYLIRAKNISTNSGIIEDIIRANGNLGIVYLYIFNFSAAKKCFDKTLNLSKEINWKESEANSLGNLGLLCQQTKDFTQAILYLEDAELIYKEIGDKKSLGKCNELIGSVLLDFAYDTENKSRYELAHHYFVKSTAIYEELGYQKGVATVLIKLGNACLDISLLKHNFEILDKANIFFEDARSIFISIDYRIGIALAHEGLASIEFGKKNFKESIMHTRETIKIFQSIGDTQNLTKARRKFQITKKYMKSEKSK